MCASSTSSFRRKYYNREQNAKGQLTQDVERDELDGLVGGGDLALVDPGVLRDRVLDPEGPGVRPGDVYGPKAGILGVGDLVHRQHVDVRYPHEGNLRKEANGICNILSSTRYFCVNVMDLLSKSFVNHCCCQNVNILTSFH